MPVLHVVIPFLDEESTLGGIVDRLATCGWPEGWRSRIVLVDDGSGPDDAETARRLAEERDAIDLVRHPRNLGKGAALRTGFALVLEDAGEDDLVAVQDADLEYSPEELVLLVEAMIASRADAAFGNRWGEHAAGRVRRVHRLGNQFLTWLSNRLTGLSLSDMECCFKMMRVPVLRTVLPDLDEDRFGIEPQMTASLARHDARIVEIDVSYEPRSFAEGKKIGPRDAVAAVSTMLREWRRTRRVRSRNS
ncbi:MAG: glycosyltransferase family 2 protein [Planctomycetota bacterium]|nr:glycosyltransferase family 2 protein [Planctomycetota bacterium]